MLLLLWLLAPFGGRPAAICSSISGFGCPAPRLAWLINKLKGTLQYSPAQQCLSFT